MSREGSPIDEIGLDLRADPEDEDLLKSDDEEETQDVEEEFADEEDYETQDGGDIDETMQSEPEDGGRLLDRGEQLRMDGGDDALLEETQIVGEDTQMQGVHDDGSESEPLAAKLPAKEKKGRGRPAGKSTGRKTAEGASESKEVPESADNPLGRQPGKSLLPLSRVTKVIKADKDIPMVAKDAVFLISLATEEFIRRLAQAAQNIASRENRATVKQSDFASAVRRIDEFMFLEDLLPYLPAEGSTKQKPKKSKVEEIKSGPMEQFIAAPKQAQAATDEDVVMQDETHETRP